MSVQRSVFVSPIPQVHPAEQDNAGWTPIGHDIDLEEDAGAYVPQTPYQDTDNSDSLMGMEAGSHSSIGVDNSVYIDTRPTPRALFHDIPVEDISLYRSHAPRTTTAVTKPAAAADTRPVPPRTSRPGSVESRTIGVESYKLVSKKPTDSSEKAPSSYANYTPLATYPQRSSALSRSYTDNESTPKQIQRNDISYSSANGNSKQQSQQSQIVELSKTGDMKAVERLALDIARLARQGDSEAVLELLQTPWEPSSVSSLTSLLSGLSTEVGDRSSEIVGFSPHITTIRPVAQGTYTVEHVPSGLVDAYPDQATIDANLLVALTQPLLDAAGMRGPLNGSFTAEIPRIDLRGIMDAILAVCHHVKKITCKEPRLLELPSPCYVLGDIHGNLTDLQFFRKRVWPNDPQATGGDFLFLGDFVDRGLDSIPVVAYIMAMKVLHPHKWWMIRGNHETREVNGNIEHYQAGSFLNQCLQAFGDHDGHIVWEAVNSFFDTLPLAATIDNQIFCVHGGIPRELCAHDGSLDLIRNVECPLRTAHTNQMVYDMLWSDPSTQDQELGQELDRNGFGLSPRGCSCFGERSMDAFLNKYNFQHVFRGHEAQKSGVGVSKSARLTTIFSTSRDHFPNDVPATCGCVLVDHGKIHPIVRSAPQQAAVNVLMTTCVQQSPVEMGEAMYLVHDSKKAVYARPPSPQHYGRNAQDGRQWVQYQHVKPAPAPAPARGMGVQYGNHQQQGYTWGF